jgi:glycosyltransferase involved in cell wall biosynthesis
MRTLVVAYEFPWPANSGSRLRLLTTLHALSGSGPTELFSITPRERTDFGEPDRLSRLENMGRVAVRTGGTSFGRVTQPLLPAGVSVTDRHQVSRALARFASGTYDLVWCFDVRAWVLAGAPDLAPAVIDLDDLEPYKIWGRLAIDPTDKSTAVSRWRGLPGRAYSQLEARRWARLYRSASIRAARTVVCSPLDADRATASGIKGVAVVPNAYARPDRPVGRSSIGSPPVVLFHGTLRYPPNADAARWLVGRIAPALRELVPDVHVRLVGLGNPGLVSLHNPPVTTVVGPVPDIVTELSRADLIVVPIRFGSGTRVKIIEAFAHRIPVASTTLGAEGLGVDDGRHLLLADTAQGLASACARLLTEPDLRQRLVDAAHERYLDSFERAVVERQVREVAQAAVTAGMPANS